MTWSVLDLDPTIDRLPLYNARDVFVVCLCRHNEYLRDVETEIVLDVQLEALEEGGFLATSPDLPGLVVQSRTRSETMKLAQANARILMEIHLSEKLPLPPALRRLFKRKVKKLHLSLPE